MIQRLDKAEARVLELEQQLRDASARASELAASLREASDARAQLQQTHGALQQALELERGVVSAARQDLVQSNAQRDALGEQLEQLKSWLDTAKDSLRTSFIEAASGVFDEKSRLLDERIKASGNQAKEQMQTTLKPFSDQVAKFQTEIGEFSEKQSVDARVLGNTIEQLMKRNAEMTDATGALTKALKGNAKTRGDWGEMILETVLKASGLEPGKHYTAQSTTRDEDTGANFRPDVIVSFPDDRQVAIDSKVNLIAWAAYNDAQTAEEEQAALVEHATALRKHVNDLASKNYPKAIGARSLDLTVLFVPIEGALAGALSTNPGLQQEAWAKGIAFASPNTLMALLKVADRMWVRDQLQKQVGDIGRHAGQLLDTVTAFLEDFEAIENRLRALSNSYGHAKNRLFESSQSVVARTRKLVESGARGKKQLHEALKPSLEDSLSALPLLQDDSNKNPEPPPLPIAEDEGEGAG